jgi:hypothetical protein
MHRPSPHGHDGMAGRFAMEVCVYERRVRTVAELAWLCEALGRLAEHLRPRKEGGLGAGLRARRQ